MEQDVLSALAAYFGTRLAIYSSRGHVTASYNGQPCEDVRSLGITDVADGFSIMIAGVVFPVASAAACVALSSIGVIERITGETVQ